MAVTGTWLPREQDVRAAVRAARRSRPFAVRNSVRIVGAVLIVVVGVLLVLGVPAAGAFGVPIGLLLGGPWAEDRRAWQLSGPYIRHSVMAVVDDTGLRYTGNGVLVFDQVWPWDRVEYAVETVDLFAFVGLKNKAGFVPYVPKRAVDADALRAVLPVEVRAQ